MNGGGYMNRNLLKHIKLAKGEKVFYDFKKLNGKSSDCRIVLTTRRIIIYNDGVYYKKKRKIRKRGINEIKRDTITHVEYYIQYLKSTYVSKVIGLVLFLAGAVAAALWFSGFESFPSFSSGGFAFSGTTIAINDMIYYGLGSVLAIVGLIVMFKSKKTLFFRIVSGHVDEYELRLKKNKYNELAINKISTRLYI